MMLNCDEVIFYFFLTLGLSFLWRGGGGDGYGSKGKIRGGVGAR